MALELENYVKTRWEPTMPITQDRMENIEDGIYDNRAAIKELEATATAAQTAAQTAQSTADSKLNQTQVDARIIQQLSGISQDTTLGREAKTEIVNATTAADPTPYANLDTRFKAAEALIKNLREALGQIYDADTQTYKDIYTNTNTVSTVLSNMSSLANSMNEQVFSAASIGRDPVTGIPNSNMSQHMSQIDTQLSTISGSLNTILDATGTDEQGQKVSMSTRIQELVALKEEVDAAHRAVETGASPDTLAQRFAAIESAINTLETTTITAIQQEIAEARLNPDSTLDARFDAIDGGSTPSRTLPNVISEINAGRGAYDSLNARFNADETNINHKVDKTNIYNALDYVPAQDVTDNKVLDARQGKELNDRLIAAETTLSNALTSTAIQTNSADTVYASLDARLEAIEAMEVAIRTEIDNAHDSAVMDNTIYDNLDARLEAIETYALAVRTDINTIADELAMIDSNTLVTTNTRIDTLESDLRTIAAELNMLDGTTIIDANTRIDIIESELTTAHRTSNDNLDARFDDIETAMTAVEALASSANTTANAAATQTALNTLDERVTNIETAPKSATVIVSFDKITYDNQTGIPTIYTTSEKTTIVTPTEQSDYLLQEIITENNELAGGKYFYWKYIGTYPNGNWNKISGDSNSGNNNAEVFNSIQAFDLATKQENKDYYVIDNQTWHHYRYIYDNVNEEYSLIKIGQNLNTDYLKRYNIATTDGDNVTYLDLYEFPYGANKSSEDIDPITDETYRITRLELPQGGGGFDDTQYRLYGRVIGDQTIKKSLAEVQADGGKVILRFGYTCYAKVGDGENDYDYKRASYVLTAEDGTIISTSNGNTISYLTKDQYAQNNYNQELVFDVTNYFTINETNAFTLTLTANVGNNEIKTKTIDVYVNIVQLSLTSSFSDATAISIYNSIEIPFTFEGIENEDYTLHVLFDDQPIQFNINRGRIIITSSQLSDKIGVHSLQIYASQVINDESLNSNSLYYQLGLIGADNLNSIMLFSGTSLDISEVEQYKILNLPYTLYIPSRFESSQAISIRIDEVDNTYTIISGDPIIRTETHEAGKYKYPFRINKMNAENKYYLVTISCTNGNTIIFKIHVKQAEEQIEIRTNNLLFNFDPMNDNYTNAQNIEDRLWTQTNNGNIYKMQIPEGTHFDWRTGGWTTTKDENGNDVPCFCVKAGSRVEFVKKDAGTTEYVPLTLFWHNMETAGSNFKCVFKIDNVKSPKAQFLTSLDNTEHSITQYGDWIKDKYQDTDSKKTLLSTYLNVKTNYIYYYNMDPAYLGSVDPETDNGDGSHDDKLGTTVLASESASTVEAIRAADESDARKKNTKKIKEYIQNIYAIVNEIDPEANYNGRSYKTFLLDLLQGNEAIQEEEEGKDPVEEAIIRNLMTLNNGIATVATNVYNTLMGTAQGESAEDIALMAAYREFSASGFNAITNGFVVEGKEKKDGIIAKLQFYIKAVTKSFTPLGNAATQIVSAGPISTNPNAKTAIYRVTIGLPNEDERIYEVNIADVYGDSNNLLWRKVAGLRDATITESHHYGLELNASGSYMYLPTGTLSYAHSEGDIIEFEYNVNSELENHIDSSVIIYEDGVPSAADIYTRGKGIFEQYNSTNNTSTAQSLTIGSDECDVYIFKMRLYDEALENSDILANFCADGLTPDDMSDRYNRNKKLVDVTSRGQEITPSLVAEACPDLRVIMIEAPRLTGGKTSFIGDTKIRCIYKNGRPEDNWVALNAYHAGQGTSSDNYGAAGRNLDIMFGFDRINTVIVEKPNKNNYHFDPNYVSILIKGIDNSLEANQNTILDAATYSAQSQNYEITTDGTGKVALSSTSVPNNWFNIKLNIASSENTNNAFLQKRFDTFLPYKNRVPARIRGRNLPTPLDIKNDMEFFNCVVFIKETGTPSEFTNDKGENRNWHFYGIGNIGDSKKTDSTRVNVPGDPQEFCVELSDNGLKNSEFSTGVFYTPIGENEIYTEHELSLTPIDLHECTASEYTNNNGYILNIANPSSTTLYLIKEELSRYTQYRRFMYINSQFIEIGRPIAFENLEVGIRYPVSKAEWKTSLNTYQKQLNNPNRAKGWDKSFEFRYDLTTKDGETIERNELEKVMNDMHQEVNKQKFVDLYEWIVMSSDDNFKTHLQDWFIEESPLYWYLFTERYTMIDSRAKNTFYHYGKIYISDDEYAGTIKETLNNMTAEQYLAAHSEITDKGNITALQIATAELTFQRATAQSIYDNRDTFLRDDPQNNSYPSQINNGYRFELWDYDNDTALGINNNGQMVFDAGLEDIDKTTNGWVYNAAESVIWCRIRDNMYNKLSELYIQLKATECFNDDSLIDQFDTLQAQFPEELWRLDFERKYFRPFKDSGETTYLSSMANGRKKYQRRQFERNMAIYISSKYLTNASYIANDQISFRPNRDIIPSEEAIITVKPYSTMYINFMIGNAENDIANDPDAKSAHVRVKAKESYSIHARDFVDRFQNFQCVIYNACRIMSIEGIDKFECKQFIFSNAKKLTALKLGGSHSNSGNVENIGDLGLNSEIPLLEELDISNIRFNSPPAELSLDKFSLLKKFNATGSNIKHFTFKEGGMLEEIKYFPGDMDQIIFNNLYKLSIVEFAENADLSKIKTYISNNSYPYSWDIVTNMIVNNNNDIRQLNLNDINWTINNINELEPLEQLQDTLGNNMYLEGHITVLGDWSDPELTHYKDEVWHQQITFDVDPNKRQIKYEVIYMESSYNNNGVLVPAQQIYSCFVGANEEIPDYYYRKTLPTRPSTIDKQYFFGSTGTGLAYNKYSGWGTSDNAATSLNDAGYNLNNPYMPNNALVNDFTITLYTKYTEKAHQYEIRWYLKREENPNDEILVQSISPSENTAYGSGGTLSAPTIQYLREHNYITSSVTWGENDTVSYSIFNGWEKTPANINPTQEEANTNIYKIYGKWEEPETPISISELFSDVSTLNSIQLLVLANMTPDKISYYGLNANMFKGKKYNYQAGYEGVITGQDLISTPVIFNNDPNNPLSQDLSNTIAPFTNNNGFTLLLDYQFAITSEHEQQKSVLAACYARDSITGSSVTGFSLCYLPSDQYGPARIVLKYGSVNDFSSNVVTVGDTTNRNIIVVRHEPNSHQLIIYSAKSGSTIEKNVSTAVIDFSTFVPNSDAKICIGALRSDIPWAGASYSGIYSDEKNNVTNGTGIIYDAVYWSQDLGDGECKQLVNWPREKFSAIIADVNFSHVAGMPAIYLTTLNSSAHGTLVQMRFSTSTSDEITRSWENHGELTSLKDICINKIFNGLPIRLQSILYPATIGYCEYVSKGELNPLTYEQESRNSLRRKSSSNNFIYLSSISSYCENGDNGNASEFSTADYKYESILERTGVSSNTSSNITPYAWMNDMASMTVFNNYDQVSNTWSTTSGNPYYYNLRFIYPISWATSNKIRIYEITTEQMNLTTSLYNMIGSNNIRNGDIVVHTALNKAYMYIDSTTISNYGIKITLNSNKFNADVGGWIESTPYYTRSVNAIDNNNKNGVIYINEIGTPIGVGSSSSQQSVNLNFSYSFTI